MKEAQYVVENFSTEMKHRQLNENVVYRLDLSNHMYKIS